MNDFGIRGLPPVGYPCPKLVCFLIPNRADGVMRFDLLCWRLHFFFTYPRCRLETYTGLHYAWQELNAGLM